jgi:hypothetical protein
MVAIEVAPIGSRSLQTGSKAMLSDLEITMDELPGASALARSHFIESLPYGASSISVFSIHLEACDPARNRFRTYRLDVARDLFGAWLVEVKFGRIGAKARKRVAALDDEHAARRMVRERALRDAKSAILETAGREVTLGQVASRFNGIYAALYPITRYQISDQPPAPRCRSPARSSQPTRPTPSAA